MEYDIKLVALDMDGTLLNSKGEISDFNKEMIIKAQSQGTVVAICTGRFTENASMVLSDAGLECPVIALNGCAVSDKPFGEKIAESTLDNKASIKVFEILEDIGADYYMFLKKKVLTRNPKDFHHSELSQGERLKKDHGVEYYSGEKNAAELCGKDVYKYYVSNKRNNIDIQKLKQRLLDEVGEWVYLTSSYYNSVEIMPKNVDKGKGLKTLAEYMNIDIKNTMAIGDEDNDMPMIRLAGLGVAMGNAIDELKRTSKAQTLSNDLDGVGVAIRNYVIRSSNE